MVERVSYRFTLPAPMLGTLIFEAQRSGTTPSRVLEALLFRHLAAFVAGQVETTLLEVAREGGRR